MKLAIALLIFVSASLHADERADYIARLPKADILKTIESMQRLTREAIADKEAAIEHNRFVTEKLVEVQRDNEAARKDAARVDTEMTRLRQWGTEQQQEAAKQKARADNEAKIARRRGMLLGYIMAGLGFFIATTFASAIPPPYNIAAIAACTAAGFAVGRFLL